MSRYRDQNIAIAAGVFFIFLAWLGLQGPGHIRKYHRIRPGMTLKQVEGILGGPAKEVYLVEGNVQAIGRWIGKLDDKREISVRVSVTFDKSGRALEVRPTWGNDQDESIPLPYRIRNEVRGPDQSDRIIGHSDFVDGVRRPVYNRSYEYVQYVLDDEGHRVYHWYWFPMDRDWDVPLRPDEIKLPVLRDPFEQ